MLQQPAPEDFVLATGETHPVREFVEKSFAVLGIQIRFVNKFVVLSVSCFSKRESVRVSTNSWRGSGVDEEGIDAKTGKTLVKVDPQYFRPAEVE